MTLSEGDPRLKKDQEPRSFLTGVFIDDDSYPLKKFTEPFLDLPSFRSIMINPFSAQNFSNSLNQIPPQEVDLVIADQFFDMDVFRPSTRKFIKRVRESNPTAWILETSYSPSGKIYPGSNMSIQTWHLIEIVKDNILILPPNAKTRLDKFKYLTSKAFQEAKSVDVLIQYGHPKPELLSRARNSKRRAQKHPYYLQALSLLQLDAAEFDKLFQTIPDESVAKVVHGLWSVIGHLEMGNSSDFYGLPLDRLRSLIKRENAP